jgi:hypothetical protein
MGWVRGHKRFGARLALVALALQLALSFGHVHPDRAASASAAIVTATLLDKAIAQSSQQSLAQNPAPSPLSDDDYCAICASIYLASTSVVALPPQLPVPIGFVRIALSYGEVFGVATPRRAAFQARAPPAA